MAVDLEFYPTPSAFTRALFRRVDIAGACFEPCVGDGAIVRAGNGVWADDAAPLASRVWTTNDLDPTWPATFHQDATQREIWDAVASEGVDWTVTNPPFTPALDIIEHALRVSRLGVAMHLRASIHEVLKTGRRRSWMREHPPSGLIWLPRFAFQRSPTSGAWSTDSVCTCWLVWEREPDATFIDYADERTLRELDEETPAYRRHVDALMAARRAA